MINQNEVPAIITDELPELTTDLKHLNKLGNIYGVMNILAGYTNRMVDAGKLTTVRKCMLLADKIYEKGNMLIKNAVENVFLFSFSSMMELHNRNERKTIQALMPLTLHTLYVQQILKTGK